MEAADLCRGTSPSRRTCKTPVKKVVNLVLDPPGNVVILTPDLYLYISASLGYHMRHGKLQDGSQETGSGTPVYTLKESAGLQGLPEFSQGSIQWGPGAVTRTLGGRLIFNKNKAIRQGQNLCHNQPIGIISNIIETFPTTEDNMRLLQGWKQVCRGWRHHISTYTGPDNQWQRNLRTEVREMWKSLYGRAMPIAQKDEKNSHLEPRKVTIKFTTVLCTNLEAFSFSRALVGGVASIISILAHTNEHLLETLGPNAVMEANPFPHGRIALQSHLTACLLRHGLAQTPWHSNRTGPWGIAPETLEETHMDILPRLLKQGHIEPAQVRTEAHRRGHDILQIPQTLLDIGNPTENDTELYHLSAHELWDLQQYHRSLISHLYVLLPILTLTGHQQPFRNRMDRVGRTLLIRLLTLCNSLESTLPDSLHAQYFGCLWKVSVPGRERNAPSHALGWADTIAIWLNPRGTLARSKGHCEDLEGEEEGSPCAGIAHQTRIDTDSQRVGLKLLRLLRSGPTRGPPADNDWKGFMLALSAPGDLLTALTHAITNPLDEDIEILSMQGIESVYRELLEVQRWSRDGPGVKSRITTLVSEGLLSAVLEKTLLYNQEEGPNNNTSTADLLLTLSLRAHTEDARVRVEISRAIHILSKGWTGQIHDLLIDWLQEAIHRFTWLWPTLRRANVIPLLMARVESTCHLLHDKSSDLVLVAHTMQILRCLSQEYSYGNDILSTRPHNLLTIADNARLMQMVRPDQGNQIRRLSPDIQFLVIICIKSIYNHTETRGRLSVHWGMNVLEARMEY